MSPAQVIVVDKTMASGNMTHNKAAPGAHTAPQLPLLRRLPHHTAGKVAMPVIQRHAVATVDSATDKATVLVGESRGFTMRAGSARKCSVTVVKVSRGLLGVRGSSKHRHSCKHCQFHHDATPIGHPRTSLARARYAARLT